MPRHLKDLSMILILALGLFIASFQVVSCTDRDDAAARINAADAALKLAYHAVGDAEVSGANITELVVWLNDAGGALSGARTAMTLGNYSEALAKAAACETGANEIAAAAGELETFAVEGKPSGWMTASLSVLGSAVFTIAMFGVWRLFKRQYSKRLLESKPEVA